MLDAEEQSRIATAKPMRELPDNLRSEAIAASDNVIDARDLFDDRQRQIALARSYGRPQNPNGAA